MSADRTALTRDTSILQATRDKMSVFFTGYRTNAKPVTATWTDDRSMARIMDRGQAAINCFRFNANLYEVGSDVDRGSVEIVGA